MTKRRALGAMAAVAACGAAILTCAHAQTSASDLQGATPPPGAIWLDSLDISQATQDYGMPAAGKTTDGNPITVDGKLFQHGLGTHADGELGITLNGGATRFISMVGVDDETHGRGSVDFQVIVDGKGLADSGPMTPGMIQTLSVDLTNAQTLTLRVRRVGTRNDYDNAEWAGAIIQLAGPGAAKPETVVTRAANVPPRLAPMAARSEPAIHGPRVVGTTPGRPFEFLVAATGEGPLGYTAKGLPAGLTLDANSGIIIGAVTKAGATRVQIDVRGPRGTAHRDLTIVAGDHRLALTPPMGWNSWNVWAGTVDQDKVKAAADAMVKSGLAAHGFQYINIDDTWEAPRSADGEIQANQKFPDMKGLADYVHGLGLKIGIYSSPGPTTCAGYPASFQHEDQDAQSYANWGFDYLKYDLCSYRDPNGATDAAAIEKPYTVMRSSLDKVNRDIVYSLCEYGLGDVWTWGAKVGGNCWRTTGDINDSWGSLHGILESQNGHEVYAGPGHWNDPDMLVVGRVGWGNPRPNHLTPNEQLLHISMWCMLSAPLLIGTDMSQMDPLTLTLLTNDEVLDIDQDPLGKPAGRKAVDGGSEVWARPLWDGSTAVALVNTGLTDREVTAKWSDIGVTGSRPVRDLWLHKDLGSFADSYSVTVPAHGVVVVKIGK